MCKFDKWDLSAKKELVRFEIEADAIEWKYYDWHVWPLLRVIIRERMFKPFLYEKNGAIYNEKKVFVKKGLKLPYRRLTDLLLKKEESPHPAEKTADVIIMTPSNRRQFINDQWIHYFADIFGDLLKKEGLEIGVWELGKKYSNKYRPSYSVELFAEVESKISLNDLKLRNKKKEIPDWFLVLEKWTKENYGWSFKWSYLFALITKIHVRSKVYEKWLRNTKTRLVMVDVWYNKNCMALSMAAKNVGIRSIDIQHGKQGHDNLAYSDWNRPEEGRFEVLPDAFWFWGNYDSEQFTNSSNLNVHIIVGGNVWLNEWIAGENPALSKVNIEAKAITKEAKKNILVTLQPHTDLERVKRIIKHSSDDYGWFLRLHREMTTEVDALTDQFISLKNKKIEIDKATNMPLYSLLKNAQVHVTSFSTCALEALAFGLPSLLLHEMGKETFHDYIKDGVMYFTENVNEAINFIDKTESIDKDICISLARNIFASPERTKNEIKKLSSSIFQLSNRDA